MPQPEYRALVNYPDGSECFIYKVVRTPEDRQEVLNFTGHLSRIMAGIMTDEDAAKLSPQRVRELSAKVQFFRVANG